MQSALPRVFVCCVELLQSTSPLRNERGGIHAEPTPEVAATGKLSIGTAVSAGRLEASKTWMNCAATLDTQKPYSKPDVDFTWNEDAALPELNEGSSRTASANASGSTWNDPGSNRSSSATQ